MSEGLKRAQPNRLKIVDGVALPENGVSAAEVVAADNDSATLDDVMRGGGLWDDGEGEGESLAADSAAESDERQDAEIETNENVEPEGESLEAEQADDDTLETEDNEAQTIVEAAEALGVEPEQLYALVVPDGTDAPKTVGEMKDELRELRKQVASGASETSAELDARRAELDQMTEQRIAAIGQVEKEYLHEMQRLDQAEQALEVLNGEQGQKLAQDDPARYSLAMVKASQQKADAGQKLSEHQSRQQSVMAHRIREEATKTAKAIEGWMTPQGQFDGARITADQTAWLAELGPEYGIQLEDIQQVVAEPFVRMMRDLAKLKAQYRNATPEKVRKLKPPRIATRAKSALRHKPTKPTKQQEADRIKSIRNLPSHHPDKIASLMTAWDD